MLASVHHQKHQQWAYEHQNWTTEQWKKVALSHELCLLVFFWYVTWVAGKHQDDEGFEEHGNKFEVLTWPPQLQPPEHANKKRGTDSTGWCKATAL